MFNFFKRNLAPAPVKHPEPGQRWEFYADTEDPFPSKYPPVKILEVKDGWVRYYMNDILRNERMRASQFVTMYKQVG